MAISLNDMQARAIPLACMSFSCDVRGYLTPETQPTLSMQKFPPPGPTLASAPGTVAEAPPGPASAPAPGTVAWAPSGPAVAPAPGTVAEAPPGPASAPAPGTAAEAPPGPASAPAPGTVTPAPPGPASAPAPGTVACAPSGPTTAQPGTFASEHGAGGAGSASAVGTPSGVMASAAAAAPAMNNRFEKSPLNIMTVGYHLGARTKHRNQGRLGNPWSGGVTPDAHADLGEWTTGRSTMESEHG